MKKVVNDGTRSLKLQFKRGGADDLIEVDLEPGGSPSPLNNFILIISKDDVWHLIGGMYIKKAFASSLRKKVIR